MKSNNKQLLPIPLGAKWISPSFHSPNKGCNLAIKTINWMLNIQTKAIFFFAVLLIPYTAFSQTPPTAIPENSSSKIKMTSLAYGGSGVMFTSVNNQFTALTGGRGSATFNNRFTFGGAGWGMPKGVEINNMESDTLKFFKFGYGGLEFGYLFLNGERVKVGSNVLFAYGAGFSEAYPKPKSSEMKLFPIVEPSLYTQITLGRLLRMDIGLTYRYAFGSKFSFISNQNISGPSIYIAFLVGTCYCN